MGDQTLCSNFSPGGKYFVTGGTDKFVRVYVCIPGPPTLMVEVLAHSVRLTTNSTDIQCNIYIGLYRASFGGEFTPPPPPPPREIFVPLGFTHTAIVNT